MSLYAKNDYIRIMGKIIKCVKEFPLETLLGLAYFVLFIINPKIQFLWFFPQYVLLFTLHKFAKGRPVVTALYILSWFLWIPVLMFGTKASAWCIGISWLIGIILLLIGDRRLDNKEYGRNILDNVLKVGAGFLVGGILIGIVLAIIGSVNFLFKFDLGEKWFSYPTAFIALVILPLLCCWFVSHSSIRVKGDKLLQIVVDYILSPALVIYAIILFFYIFRILLKWELPQGGVAYLVISFICIALLCHLLRLQLEKRHFEWFYKAFPIIAIAPLVLLWIGIFRRVGEYGITEARFYLILLALLLTVFVAMLSKDRWRNFQLMTLILVASAALFTFVPGIRAKDFERRSQLSRPVNEDGNVVEDTKEALAERSWSFKDLSEPLDLGEYTQLVPPSQYCYYEDSAMAIFFKDENRTEKLLECNILEMMDSPEDSPLDKLVFSNDSYKVIFNRIEDMRYTGSLHFITSGHMLFRKPE